MAEVRRIHFLDGKKFGMLPDPCSQSLEGHDWAQLIWEDMVVLVRCQKCGHTPLEVLSMLTWVPR